MGVFAKHLVRLRKESGHHSAYKFYHGNGGRRHFPFTYAHYLRIERGEKLPRPEWMAPLFLALRLVPGKSPSRNAFRAYLKDLLKTEEAYDLIMGTLLSGKGSEPAAEWQPFRWMGKEHSMHLTQKQFEEIVSDETIYWCSEILMNDRGTWTAEKAAQALDLKPKAVLSAFKRLKACGLAKEISKGRFKSKHPGKFFTFPGRLRGMQPPLNKVKTYWDKMHRRRGKSVADRVELVRAEPAGMRGCFVQLAQAMDAANAVGTKERGEDTGLYLIETRIRRVMDF